MVHWYQSHGDLVINLATVLCVTLHWQIQQQGEKFSTHLCAMIIKPPPPPPPALKIMSTPMTLMELCCSRLGQRSH